MRAFVHHRGLIVLFGFAAGWRKRWGDPKVVMVFTLSEAEGIHMELFRRH